MAKPSTKDKISATRAELEATDRQIGELEAKRRAALLADDDGVAAKLANQIDQLRQLARGHQDKIGLFEAALAEEEAAAVAKRRAGLVDRFAKLLEQADALADVAEKQVAELHKTFREIIELRERARAAFPTPDSHTAAVAQTPEGCAMSGVAVAALLKYELYRVGARPFMGGHLGAKAEVGFPGGAYPDQRLMLQPEKITPFATALRRASAHAVEIMRSGRVDPLTTLPPAPESPAAKRLSFLLTRQAALAATPFAGPDNEREYQSVVAEIAKVQGEIDAAKQGALT